MTWNHRADASRWAPEAQPASGNAADYEGQNSNVTSLLEWDHGGVLAAPSWADGHAVLSYTGDASTKAAGVYKAVPASEFAFYAKLSILYTYSQTVRYGIAFLQDATSSTGDMESCFAQANSGGASVAHYSGNDYSAPFTTVRTDATNVKPSPTMQFFRGRMNGSTVSFDVSGDGTSWVQIGTRAMAYTPQHVALWLESPTAGATPIMKVRFLRFFTGAGSSAVNATFLGRENAQAILMP